MASKGNTETEVKIRVPSLAPIRARLRKLGFRLSQPRLFESNELWDTPGADLRTSGKLLRLRRSGKTNILTFKGPAQTGGVHKSREEVELQVSDDAQCRFLFERLGYQPGFRYEKYRSEYSDGCGVVTLDETPIGFYLELEGEGAWIDRTAAALGFSAADYITSSYGRLYLEHCEARGLRPTHMVFEKNPLVR